MRAVPNTVRIRPRGCGVKLNGRRTAVFSVIGALSLGNSALVVCDWEGYSVDGGEGGENGREDE